MWHFGMAPGPSGNSVAKSADNKSERIGELAELILKNKRLYYAGKPKVSDQTYDRWEEELKKLSPQHPVLAMVGDLPASTSRKSEHATPMLSLEKTYVHADLVSWVADHAVVGTLKIDGNSLSLIYEHGRLILAKTRGNGRVGEDVTDKARWVPNIPGQLSRDISVEIRGELVCRAHAFATLSAEMEALGLERPTNPRNIVAGLLGRKTHYELSHHFYFIAFDVVLPGQVQGKALFTDEIGKFSWLAAEGFVTPLPKLLKTAHAVENYLAEVKEHMDNGEDAEFALDGAVFTYNNIHQQEELAYTSHHPRFKLAFKWQGDTATSKIVQIDWATSRLGIVTPVAVIEPVYLSGAEITNITLHNADHVRSYNLKSGDTIRIVRSGEVIPKFLEVVEAGKGDYVWPKKCPSCGTTLENDDIRLTCPNNQACPAQLLGGILNWIVSAEIEDLSEKRLSQMIEAGLVASAPDLYKLTVEDLLKLPATKDKMANKLFDHIQKSKKLPLARFLTGLGIEGTGLTTWEKIIEHKPSLESIQAMSEEDLVAIDGFAEKSAASIVAGLSTQKNLIKGLLKVGVEPTLPAATSKDGPLVGMTFVITGALSIPRGDMEKLIKAAGGKLGSSVSANTTAVITNESDTTSSKMKKARALDIPIWDEAKIRKELG